MKLTSKLTLWTIIVVLVVASGLFAAPNKITKEAARVDAGIASVRLQNSNRLDNQGGPDGFGYHYVDNQSGDTATYAWIELRGDAGATWLDFSENPDDDVLPVPLTFAFPFYGAEYDTVYVSTNGNLQFDSQNPAFSNECFPSAIIGGRMICPLWTDLHLDHGGYNPGGNRTIAYRNFGDYVVIEWDSVGQAFGENTSFKFEVELWADGRIKIQYNQLTNLAVFEQTIGIQSGGYGAWLEYFCYSSGHAPMNQLAIWFYPGPTGVIMGWVRDDAQNPIANAVITINDLGISTISAGNGSYAFPRVGVGTYTLTAMRVGYVTDEEENVQVVENVASGADFTLQWAGIHTFTATDVPQNIVDNQTITSQISVPQNLTIVDIGLMVSILHTYASDLEIAVVSPALDTVVLASDNGGGGENFLNTIFDDDAVIPIGEGVPPFTGYYIPVEPLSEFHFDEALGTWRLLVTDMASGDQGSLLGWELYIMAQVSADDPIILQPGRLALNGNYPNPFNSTTQIRYSVPRDAFVSLSLYNIMGQNIRTLVSESVSAGTHTVLWDGRDTRGVDAATGLYLVRLESAGSSSTHKVMLLR